MAQMAIFLEPPSKIAENDFGLEKSFFLKTLDVSKSLSSKQIFHGTFCSCAFEVWKWVFGAKMAIFSL